MKKSVKVISVLCIITILFSIILPSIVNASSTSYTQTIKSGIEQFPESYRKYLYKIQDLHPNWTFDAYYTGISWNTLVEKETDCGHNRIIASANSLWKCNRPTSNVESGYACASDAIIKYYMDPRNFIGDDVKIFQFLEISYNEKISTVDSIKTTIASTFMNSDYKYNKDGIYLSYADIILEAAKQSKMSPFSIATKIIQEVGSKGSESVFGRYPGYEGYYNFFNYGANDEGNAIENGLKYARDKGWNNPYTAIVEGAKLLANSYTNAGQNTAYFYKWDVVGSTILTSGNTQTVVSSTSSSENQLFRHQYMTNVEDPTSQARNTYSTYVKNGIIDEKLNFIIPIYDNMPAANKLPTNLTTKDGALYYLTGTAVRLREAPSTSAKALATLNTLDEIVAVIERETATDSTGRKWDKVKISSGQIGYIASQYLSPCQDDTTQQVQQKAEAKIDGTNIKATPTTTVSKVGELLKLTKYEVYSGQTKITEDSNLATGYILKDLTNNKQYTVVVMGDVNGDGKISSSDYVRIKNKLREKVTLDEFQNKASDANFDGKITSADYVKVKNVLRGKTTINM